jgi:hypothetical protein
LCSEPAEDCSDAIALHLASQTDPVKAIADFHMATFKASQVIDKEADAEEVKDSAKLHELTEAQIDHVSLGLERSFDCQLIRDGSFFLVHEFGKRRFVIDSLTVIQVWNIAKELTREDC